jgi:hypothetical protein
MNGPRLQFEILPADDSSGEPATALAITVIIDE